MPDKALSIELNHDPEVLLVYSNIWTCDRCHRHIALVAKDEWHCILCMIERNGKPTLLISGWQLSKSSGDQVNASRLVPAD